MISSVIKHVKYAIPSCRFFFPALEFLDISYLGFFCNEIIFLFSFNRSEFKINLVHELCHKVANYCPAGCNSTESEVAAAKEKYLSERPPIEEKGPLKTIVAATWMVWDFLFELSNPERTADAEYS